MNLPKIGSHHDVYSDGKISPSRMFRVVVTDIIHRRDMTDEAAELWKKAIDEDIKDVFRGFIHRHHNDGTVNGQMYDWNCDDFIVASIIGDKDTENDPILFAKRIGGDGWYGLNWNFELDIGSVFRKRNLRVWKKCAKEAGEKMVYNRKTELYDYVKVCK